MTQAKISATPTTSSSLADWDSGWLQESERLLNGQQAYELLSSGSQFLLAALLFWGAAVTKRAAHSLPKEGVLPRFLVVSKWGLRFAGLYIGLIAVAQVVPSHLYSAVLVAAVVGVVVLLVVGREVLPDIFAGLWLRFEGNYRPGVRVRSDTVTGTIRNIGMRTVELSRQGEIWQVPHRRFLSDTFKVSDETWPQIQLALSLPEGPQELLRRAIEDALIASPWVPLEAEPKLRPDPERPGWWLIRARVLKAEYADELQSRLGEAVSRQLSFIQEQRK